MTNRAFRPLGLSFLLLSLVALVRGATADEDFAAWQEVHRERPSRDKATSSKDYMDDFWRAKAVELERVSDAFVAAHPQDSRRWEVMLRSIQMARWRTSPDEAARERAVRQDTARLQQITQAADAGAEIVEQAHSALVQRHLDDAGARHAAGQPLDPAPLARSIDEFAAKYPQSRTRSLVERRFLDLLSEMHDPSATPRMERLVGDANGSVAEVARTLLEKAGYLGRELEMKFTAADGREVDLAALRGKVVLVDFWATWCGPCMNEMPHVKEAYAKYRDRGFEVIGVSLDGGGITKGIQSGVKTKADFLAFLEREQMPWPQHYDNLGWKNEFAQKFRIKSIPAVFLLDRSGRVISTELRGEGFDRQIGKALGG